ncbi:MAG TPA: helix-turn-helix domain-containing protein [Gemmataceae bacterium]|nr:helix-turn-helix domain-containing protein [Gemmataceae bacterium]
MTKDTPMDATAAPVDEAAVYTIADLARLTKTSERHIYRLIDAGKVPGCIRLGRAVRFAKKIVDAWLAGESVR